MKWNHYFIAYIEMIYRYQKSKKISILHAITFPLSLVFLGVSRIKRFYWQSRIHKTFVSTVPIVSVGNIEVGGTGKTPLEMRIIEDLHHVNIGLVTRGYFKEVLTDSFNRKLGDEGALIKKRYPFVSVVANVSRKKAIKELEPLVDVILLDDGFQQHSIKKSIDIVTVKSSSPLGEKGGVPYGSLRERSKALQYASYVCITNSNTDIEYEKAKEMIKNVTNAKVFGASYSRISFRTEYDEDVRWKRVALFCGIGNPELFRERVKSTNKHIVNTLFYPDHMPATKEALETFVQESKGAEVLVCTEKDAIKFPKNMKLSIPVVIAYVDFRIEYGIEVYKEMLALIQNKEGNQ